MASPRSKVARNVGQSILSVASGSIASPAVAWGLSLFSFDEGGLSLFSFDENGTVPFPCALASEPTGAGGERYQSPRQVIANAHHTVADRHSLGNRPARAAGRLYCARAPLPLTVRAKVSFTQ